ncbi:MAG: VOC family protein [Polyangiaceae bacterium]|nr:VOC family protein [Polyangiaceae bacterium]
MLKVIDHIGINVTDYERAKKFYAAALAPLGIEVVMEFGHAVGFGKGGKPEFWIGTGKASFQSDAQVASITPIHVCFTAATRADVDAFYKAAIAAGGKDFGGPGVRAHYHPNYYGAFVLDFDGHNIEAACHLAE